MHRDIRVISGVSLLTEDQSLMLSSFGMRPVDVTMCAGLVLVKRPCTDSDRAIQSQ